jgi:hypothetical protein
MGVSSNNFIINEVEEKEVTIQCQVNLAIN